MQIATLEGHKILLLAYKNIQWGRTFLRGVEMMTGILLWRTAFGSGLAGEGSSLWGGLDVEGEMIGASFYLKG